MASVSVDPGRPLYLQLLDVLRAELSGMRPERLRSFSTRFVAITQLGAKIHCEGTVAELFEAGGEARARIALSAKDENGETKLSGEAIVAI